MTPINYIVCEISTINPIEFSHFFFGNRGPHPVDSSNFRSESTGDMPRVRAGPFQMATGLLRNFEKIEFQSNIFGGSCKTSIVLSVSSISPSNTLMLELPSSATERYPSQYTTCTPSMLRWISDFWMILSYISTLGPGSQAWPETPSCWQQKIPVWSHYIHFIWGYPLSISPHHIELLI